MASRRLRAAAAIARRRSGSRGAAAAVCAVDWIWGGSPHSDVFHPSSRASLHLPLHSMSACMLDAFAALRASYACRSRCEAALEAPTLQRREQHKSTDRSALLQPSESALGIVRLSDAEDSYVNLGSPDLRYCASHLERNKSGLLLGDQRRQDAGIAIICGGMPDTPHPPQMMSRRGREIVREMRWSSPEPVPH